MKGNFSGYILAGGKSARMGADKAFLRIGDETFLSRAMSNLEKFGNAKIILNRLQTTFTDKLKPKYSYIFDQFDGRGALGGIHAALADCETEFAFILAVDLPFVTADSIEKMSEIAISANVESAVVPVQNDGRAQPLCAFYRAKVCLPIIEKLLSENQRASVIDFMTMIAPKYIETKALSDDEELLFNVNFPSDFESIKNGSNLLRPKTDFIKS